MCTTCSGFGCVIYLSPYCFRADPGAAARFALAHRDALAANATAAESRWFQPNAVRAFIDAAQTGSALDFPLWRIINLKLWARAHWPA